MHESGEGKGSFFKIGSHGKQRVGRKAGRTQRWVNGTPNQMLDGRISWDNGQNQIVRSLNNCCSSFRVAYMDENKTLPSKDYHDSYSNYTQCPNCIAFGTGKKGARLAESGALVTVFEKSAIDLKLKQIL